MNFGCKRFAQFMLNSLTENCTNASDGKFYFIIELQERNGT